MNTRKTESANIRLESELKQKAEDLANINGLSLSDLVRLALLSEIQSIEAGNFRLISIQARK